MYYFSLLKPNRKVFILISMLIVSIKVFSIPLKNADYFYNKGASVLGLHIDSSLLYYNRALILYEQSQDYKGILKTQSSKSQAFCSIGMLDSAMISANAAEGNLTALTSDSLKGYYHCALLRVYGFVENERGNPHKADSIFRIIRHLAKQHQLNDQYLTATLNTGMVLRQQGHLSEAFDFYNEAYQISDTICNYDMSFTLLIWMAQILGDVNQPEQALTYLDKTEAIKDSASYTGHLVDRHLAYGYVHYLSGNLDTSLVYYRRANEISNSKDMPYFASIAMVNLGEVFLDNGQTDSAYHYLTKSLKIFTEIQNHAGVFYANSLLGGYYLKRNSLNKAKQYMEKAEALARQLTVPPILCRNHYERCYELYKTLGAESLALQYYETYNDYKQQLLNYEVQWSISRLERNLQLAEKVQTIEKQTREIEKSAMQLKLYRSRITMLVVLMVFAVSIVLFGFMAYRYRQRKAKELHNAEMQQVISNYKLKNIQTQMSPHFVFNALNNLWAVFNNNDKNSAYNYLLNLSQLIRNTLVNSEKNVITLQEEIDFVNNYLKIETLNHKNIIYNIRIDEKLNTGYKVIPMCIQTHVENAIKHGLRPRNGVGEIEIRLTGKNGKLIIEIEDNGIGREKAALNSVQSTGIGLKSQEEMIQLYNKSNIHKISLNIIDKNIGTTTGTIVQIEIPKNYRYILN